jgi:hypothetical protein
MKKLKIKTDNTDFLREVVEILSNIETDWDEKLTKHQLIPFFEKYLSDEKTYDELLQQIILFLGNIGSVSVNIYFFNKFYFYYRAVQKWLLNRKY